MAIPVLPPPSAKAVEIGERVKAFLEEHIIPAEHTYHQQLDEGGDRWKSPPIMDELKAKAKKAGLWNLFLPKKHFPDSLTNLEYASICEMMGRSPIGGEPFNCSAPDTGNMETLILYATPEQKKQWLEPLMDGHNPLGLRDDRAGGRLLGRDQHPLLDQARRRPLRHQRAQVVDLRRAGPSLQDHDLHGADRPGQRREAQAPVDGAGADGYARRDDDALAHVFGYDDAPHGHGEVDFKDVRVPVSNILLGEGRGFEIAQGRLGPGRIHHCMRTIGLAERTLESMCQRAMSRTAFGKTVAEQGVTRQWIAESRMEIDQSRLLTLYAAHMMDTVGNKEARREIAMIKVVAPKMAQKLVDRAIQVHGGGGVSQDFHLAYAYARTRTMRIVDGPDAVHEEAVARLELRKYEDRSQKKK